MKRLLGLGVAATAMVVAFGCGTLCKHRPPNNCPPQGKAVFVPPPPPTVQGPLVPAGGATFGPPGGTFPAAPPQGAATFGAPDAPFPKVPPSITPMPPKEIAPRVESKWQPGENPDSKPRVQLYAPEAVEKEKPKITEEPPTGKKPSATFPAIAQFAEVKSNVYVGLRPGKEGLDWLQANRLGTVVNLRMPGEDDAADQKDVESRGIRYVAVEISPQNLSKEGFDGFIDLIRKSADKGVFVYDRDGSLAGPLWYLYLRLGEFLDDDAAQLRAKSLGLQQNRDGAQRDMWLAVQKLLSENNR